MFRVSIGYLFVVFGAMLLDCAVRSWLGGVLPGLPVLALGAETAGVG